MNKCKSCGIDYNDHLGIEGTCKDLLKAKKRIDELEKALEFYAKGHHYDFEDATYADPDTVHVVYDKGEIARQALKEGIQD